jgi:hypothetical protein
VPPPPAFRVTKNNVRRDFSGSPIDFERGYPPLLLFVLVSNLITGSRLPPFPPIYRGARLAHTCRRKCPEL